MAHAHSRAHTHVAFPPCSPTVKLAADAEGSNVIVSGSARLAPLEFVVVVMMMPKVAGAEGRGKVMAIWERG